MLKPGGYLFWREPALMFLYGPHDKATHVQRRYNTGAFAEKSGAMGLKPLRLSYSNYAAVSSCGGAPSDGRLLPET